MRSEGASRDAAGWPRVIGRCDRCGPGWGRCNGHLPEHRMGRKFIPDGDQDFLDVARSFANHLAARPQVFGTTESAAQQIVSAVEVYSKAMMENLQGFTRSRASAARK